jgi:hypothetical protein
MSLAFLGVLSHFMKHCVQYLYICNSSISDFTNILLCQIKFLFSSNLFEVQNFDFMSLLEIYSHATSIYLCTLKIKNFQNKILKIFFTIIANT